TNVNADYRVTGSVAAGSGPTRTAAELRVAEKRRASDGNTAGTNGAVHDRTVESGFSRTNSRTNGRGRTNIKGDLRFLESTIAGAAIESGSTVGFSMNGSEIGYSADATVSNLDLQRVGRELNVPALAADRYASTINGHVTAQGKGTDPRQMDVTASGTLSDTTIMGGRIPQLTFEAALAGDTAHLRAQGAVADVDPAVASGRPDIKGTVGGRLDIEATVARVSQGVTPEAVQA